LASPFLSFSFFSFSFSFSLHHQDASDKHIIWIQYEEMKKNPFEETQRLAQFLNCSYANDAAYLSKVVELSSFEAMQSQAKEKAEVIASSSASSGSDPKKLMSHLRKGIIGDWKNHFSSELFTLFKEKTEKEFKGIEINIQYE
jgi:hypothetical protein